MSVVAPLGPVYQAGTLSGNPLATAAGLAALEHLDADAYRDARGDGDAPGRRPSPTPSPPPASPPSSRGRRRSSGCTSRADAADRLRLGPAAPTRRATPRLFHALLRRGVALAPGAYEVLFPGLAHTAEIVDELVVPPSEQPSADLG